MVAGHPGSFGGLLAGPFHPTAALCAAAHPFVGMGVLHVAVELLLCLERLTALAANHPTASAFLLHVSLPLGSPTLGGTHTRFRWVESSATGQLCRRQHLVSLRTPDPS
jgi:hypothetical protein